VSFDAAGGDAGALPGYRLFAGHHLRIDALDRFLTRLAETEKAGFVAADPALASLLGLRKEALAAVMEALGYRAAAREVSGFERRPAGKGRKNQRKPAPETALAAAFLALKEKP
jgi:hypothetical protein